MTTLRYLEVSDDEVISLIRQVPTHFTSKGLMAPGLGQMGPQAQTYDDQLSPSVGASVWDSAPQCAMMRDMLAGSEFMDDFIGLVKAADAWILSTVTSGTATAGSLAGGTAALNAGATTANQGVELQRAGGHFLTATGKHMWFECRFKVNVLAAQIMCGLANITTTVFAAGAISATDIIGYTSLTGDGVMLQNTRASGTGTTNTGPTLVAATYIRLGFTVVDNTTVTFYVNGVAQATKQTTNIPSASLAPVFVLKAAGGGTTPQMDLDYVNVIQLR
jgi:hypothetical protein